MKIRKIKYSLFLSLSLSLSYGCGKDKDTLEETRDKIWERCKRKLKNIPTCQFLSFHVCARAFSLSLSLSLTHTLSLLLPFPDSLITSFTHSLFVVRFHIFYLSLSLSLSLPLFPLSVYELTRLQSLMRKKSMPKRAAKQEEAQSVSLPENDGHTGNVPLSGTSDFVNSN